MSASQVTPRGAGRAGYDALPGADQMGSARRIVRGTLTMRARHSFCERLLSFPPSQGDLHMAGDHGSSAKAILYAFLANLGIAITKTGAAAYTNSGSMLAEAIHSYADCANQLLLFLGLKQADKPPTAAHPLGYGKVTYFWSFIVALLLFSLGGLFSIYEGWHKLHAPEP
jgi:Co/Zn/Cd efflux system component